MSDPQEQRKQEQEESRRVQQERLQEYQRIQREQGHAAAVAFEAAATQSHRMGLTAQEGLELGRQRADEAAEGVARARQEEMLQTRQQIQREQGEAAARQFEQSVTTGHRIGLSPRESLDRARQAAGLQAPPTPTQAEPTPDPEVEFLIREGHTPEDAFVLAQARRARREVEAEGGEFLRQDLRIDESGQVTGTTTFRGVDPLEPESRFPDRFEDERLNIEFVRGQRIGDILIARAAERERAGPIMAYDPDALRDYLESFSRPPVEADFSSEQATAISRAQQRGTQLAIERGDIEQDPTMPWATVRAPRPDTPIPEPQRIATRAPTGDPIRDAATAFTEEFWNIGRVLAAPVRDLFGGREVPRRVVDPQTGEVIRETGQPPEIAPTVTGAVIGASLQPTGRRIVTPLGIVRIPGEERAAQLQQITREVRESPAAAIGSIAATAAITLAPIGKSPIGRAAATSARAPIQTAPTGVSIAAVSRAPVRPVPPSPFVSQTVVLGRGPVTTAPARPFTVQTVDLGRGTAAAVPRRTFTRETIDLGRGEVSLARIDPVTGRVATPRPTTQIRPEDVGLRETRAPDGTIQLTRIEQKQVVAPLRTRTVQRTLTRERVDLGRGTVSLQRAAPAVRTAVIAPPVTVPVQRTRAPVSTRQVSTTTVRPRMAERSLLDVTPTTRATQIQRPVTRTTQRADTMTGLRTSVITTTRITPRTATRTDPLHVPLLRATTQPPPLRVTMQPPPTPRTPPRRTPAPPIIPPLQKSQKARVRDAEMLGPVGIKTKGVRNILFEPLSINDTESKPPTKKRSKRDMFDISL